MIGSIGVVYGDIGTSPLYAFKESFAHVLQDGTPASAEEVLGIISLSLMFLGGYGGMVSLAQMTVAGIAGYMIAIIGGNSYVNVHSQVNASGEIRGQLTVSTNR